MSGVIHRWQVTFLTPCGREINPVAELNTIRLNWGERFDDGVTCKACKRSNTRYSYMGRPAPPAPATGETDDAERSPVTPNTIPESDRPQLSVMRAAS